MPDRRRGRRLSAVALACSVGVASAGKTCVISKNYMNAQYTVEVAVGSPPQYLDAVPDTGSFELILASTGCDGCAPHKLFDRSKSSSFQPRGDIVETHFGQGRVRSQVHYDQLTLGQVTVPRQSVLLMQQNELRGFAEASYDAVMGLGMQNNARSNDTDLSLMSEMGTHTAMVCYGQRDGDPGRLQLGGGIPGLNYVEMPVIGDLHWALRLDGVSVGGGANLGCDGPPHCSAIIDSGTSLIAVPAATLDQLLLTIGDVNPDCSNIDSLPTLHLQMGAHTLELPPQLYVAKLKDVEEEQTVGWGMFKFPFKTGRLVEACLPLFMEMDMTTALHGPVWILGMPFLRAYSATFNRESRQIGLAQLPLGSDVCTHCNDAPTAPAFHAKAGSANLQSLLPSSKDALALKKAHAVKPSAMSLKNLMLPTWASRSGPTDGPEGQAPRRRVLTL